MNNYIKCLEAAGWIDPGLLDEDYQDYLNRGKLDRFEWQVDLIGDLSYEDWLKLNADADGENHHYESVIKDADIFDGGYYQRLFNEHMAWMDEYEMLIRC